MLTNKRKINFSDLVNENNSKIVKDQVDKYIKDKQLHNTLTNIDNLMISLFDQNIRQ